MIFVRRRLTWGTVSRQLELLKRCKLPSQFNSAANIDTVCFQQYSTVVKGKFLISGQFSPCRRCPR